MALTMLDKTAERSEKNAWPAQIAAEFEQESKNPNPCVGNALVSETRAGMDDPAATRRARWFPSPMCSTTSGPR